MLERGAEGQTGLVVFAGDAFTVSPLTQDADTIVALLSALDPEIMPAQGSRVDLGLGKAGALIRQAGLEHGEIWLITDTSGDPRALAVAGELRETGIRVSVLAVATEQGAPIPIPSGGFVTDSAGGIVVPRLDEAVLRELARAGGGRYALIRSDGRDIDRLLGAGDTTLDLETMETERETQAWREEGPWLVLTLLPLAALAFRRGWLLALPIWLMALPQPSQAFDWADLWLRPDQQAARALARGDSVRAAELARDPLLRGVAAYRAGDYDTAVQSFTAAAGADALYNRGNALARLGRYRQAIEAYDEALKEAPDMEDARFNRALIEILLRQRHAEQTGGEDREADQTAPGAFGTRRTPDGHEQGSQNDRNALSARTVGTDPKQSLSTGVRSVDAGRIEEPASPRTDPTPGKRGKNEAGAQDFGARSTTVTGRDGPEDGETHYGLANVGESDSGATEAPDIEPRSGPGEGADVLDGEAQQVVEQWLRRIPDDPGGLLRRKFLRQHRRRGERTDAVAEPAW
jgi:Ca-activated chloride channel family protein